MPNDTDPANEASLDQFFGTTQWRDVRNQRDRETASVRLYTEQLRATGRYTYATAMRILKPLHNRAYFHLSYATRNPKGIIEFRKVEKEAFKEQDNVRTTAQRLNREDRRGQIELIFGTSETPTARHDERVQQLQQAEALIYNLLKKGPIRYEVLQPLILELPLVWNTDLNEIIMEAHRKGQVVIQGMAPHQRTPKAGNIIDTIL